MTFIQFLKLKILGSIFGNQSEAGNKDEEEVESILHNTIKKF